MEFVVLWSVCGVFNAYAMYMYGKYRWPSLEYEFDDALFSFVFFMFGPLMTFLLIPASIIYFAVKGVQKFNTRNSLED